MYVREFCLNLFRNCGGEGSLHSHIWGHGYMSDFLKMLHRQHVLKIACVATLIQVMPQACTLSSYGKFSDFLASPVWEWLHLRFLLHAGNVTILKKNCTPSQTKNPSYCYDFNWYPSLPTSVHLFLFPMGTFDKQAHGLFYLFSRGCDMGLFATYR